MPSRTSPYTTRVRAAGLRLLLAAMCVPVAVCAWFAGAVLSVGGVDWAPGAAVRADEEVRTVPVEARRPTLVWSAKGYAHQPVCQVTDAVSGDRLDLAAAPRGYARDEGRTQWFARQSFVPDSDQVLVTCVGNDQHVLMVEAKPALPGSLESAGWAYVAPALVLLGGVGLGASGVRRLRDDRYEGSGRRGTDRGRRAPAPV